MLTPVAPNQSVVSSKILMNSTSDGHANVVARFIGLDAEGRGKVEILADVLGLKLGEELVATVRPGPYGAKPLDYNGLRKFGLRKGGLVLMRKAKQEEDGTLSSKTVEIVIASNADGYPALLHDAAVCILPPPEEESMLVSECLVALAASSISIKSVNSGLVQLHAAIEQACLFGKAGIILTGEDAEGDVSELIVGGLVKTTPDALVTDFIKQCPKAVIQDVKDSKKPWKMTAFFRGDVDPERTSKISAQRNNYDYGNGVELSWTKANIVLRAIPGKWLVCDATPTYDLSRNAAGLLLDVL